VARACGGSREQATTASRQRLTAWSHSNITNAARRRSARAHARPRHSSTGSTTIAVASLARHVARGGDETTTDKATRDVVPACGNGCTNAQRHTLSAVTMHTQPASLRRCRAQILKHENQPIRARLRLKQKVKTLVDPKGFVSEQQARPEGDQQGR